MDSIVSMLKNDEFRLNILQIVSGLKLPQCYVAAGFVRNMVWDDLHGFERSPLNDIDIIYFNPDEENISHALEVERELNLRFPDLNWQVRNQALMHIRNGDGPYKSSVDAMRYWPEIETAVAARINPIGCMEVAAPFGVESLLNLEVTYNPNREFEVFEKRVKSKMWLAKWPKLRVNI